MIDEWVSEKSDVNTNILEKDPQRDIGQTTGNVTFDKRIDHSKVNYILEGSKVTGDISVSCNLVLSGHVEGNITAQENSNIVIKGFCKGNITTPRGDIDIRGELQSGKISTEGNVSISGKFTGGEVKVGGKIYVNCEFTGKLEGNEIEIGPRANVRGEIFYKEYITISRGAKVEVHLSRIDKDHKGENKSQAKKGADMQLPVKELSDVNPVEQ